jgi:2-methylisocitrate lyase-like PEP mutase family enzyme
MNSDIIIIARADSRQTLRFDEAIERLKEAKKIGADIVILEAIQSREECKKVCEIMGDTPVLFSMVPGAGLPDLTVEEAKELDFRLIIFPGVCLSMVLNSCKESLALLEEKGGEEVRGVGGVKQLFTICGLDITAGIGRKARGKAYENV